MKLYQEYANSINEFKFECTNLVELFKAEDKKDYSTFVTLWRAHKFYVIYEKYRKSSYDNNQFKEDTLQIAKRMMLGGHFVGGLFLLFGLYYIQIDPKATIRLELGELESILNNIQEDRISVLETFQPALMVAKLLKNKAFSFVRFSKEYTIEGQNRGRLVHNETQAVLSDRVQPAYWLKRKFDEIGILKQLKEKNEQYSKFREDLKKDYPELNLALGIAPDNVVGGLENLLAPGNPLMTTNELSEIGEKRRALKNRVVLVKQRYTKPESEEDNVQPSTSGSGPSAKRKGTGQERISYIRTMVNESDSGSGSHSEDEEEKEEISGEESVLALPDI